MIYENLFNTYYSKRNILLQIHNKDFDLQKAFAAQEGIMWEKNNMMHRNAFLSHIIYPAF